MRLLLALGMLGGAMLVGYAFLLPACAPVTPDTAVFCSRVWTPALLGMTLGFADVAEYWLFFEWPHRGPDGWLRAALWMSFLLGWLAVITGAIAAGVLMSWPRNPLPARLVGSLLITMSSLTVFIGLFAVAILAIGTSAFALIASVRSAGGATADAS